MAKSTAKQPAGSAWRKEARALVNRYTPSLRSMIRYKGLKKVTVTFGGTPDIASIPGEGVILIGRGWVKADKMRPEARGSLHRERKKRFMHELIHIADGLEHNERSRKLGYYSDPARDTYTWAEYARWESR